MQKGDISSWKEKIDREGAWHREQKGSKEGKAWKQGKPLSSSVYSFIYLFSGIYVFIKGPSAEMSWNWTQSTAEVADIQKHLQSSNFNESSNCIG